MSKDNNQEYELIEKGDLVLLLQLWKLLEIITCIGTHRVNGGC